MSNSAIDDSEDDVMIIVEDSDEENSNDTACSSSATDADNDVSNSACWNPWHDKWGNNDTNLKYLSQTAKMAQFIFTLLGYDPAKKNQGRKCTKFCATCIEKAQGLTVEEFKEIETQARSKWNQGVSDSKDGSTQDQLLIHSRRQSENAHIQAQLEKLEKLDISDEEKAKQAKQLRMLAFVNPGKFMDDFDPERSAREMKKMNRRLCKEKNIRKNQMYDEKGILLSNGKDLCDCLDVDCPGCHFPCPRCASEKCGGDCRCNRKWIYEYVESEGTGNTYSWPPDEATKT